MHCSDQLTKRRFLLIAFESTSQDLCRATALLGIYVVSGSAILISRRTLVFLNLELAIAKFLPCAFRMFHAYLSTSGLVSNVIWLGFCLRTLQYCLIHPVSRRPNGSVSNMARALQPIRCESRRVSLTEVCDSAAASLPFRAQNTRVLASTVVGRGTWTMGALLCPDHTVESR